MTYRLNPEVRKITSPIILSFSDGRESERFQDGASLADAVLCRNYLIESLSVRNECVVLTVRENNQANAMDQAGGEAVERSFF